MQNWIGKHVEPEKTRPNKESLVCNAYTEIMLWAHLPNSKPISSENHISNRFDLVCIEVWFIFWWWCYSEHQHQYQTHELNSPRRVWILRIQRWGILKICLLIIITKKEKKNQRSFSNSKRKRDFDVRFVSGFN